METDSANGPPKRARSFTPWGSLIRIPQRLVHHPQSLRGALITLTAMLLFACGEPQSPASREAATLDEVLTTVDWPTYLGDPASSQHSPLSQITPANVNQLELAWHYRASANTPPEHGSMPVNPLIIGGVLYGLSPNLDLFALNGATGEELWRAHNASRADHYGVNAVRGLAYWSEGEEQRLLYSADATLLAIDPLSGSAVESFGRGGAVDLRAGLPDWAQDEMVIATTPGAVFEDLLIIGSRVSEFRGAAPGHVRAFDIRTGALRWVFHTIPQKQEYGADTWPDSQTRARAGGANSWAGITIDVDRGIAFVPTGSATFDFYGGDRRGDNLFANSLVALNARTGERLWHYQFVRHDLWDRDLPSPPNLVSIKRDGIVVPAVAQATKTGHVFLFHRETGEVLSPMEEVPVTGRPLPGEAPATSQPLPLSPPPFHRQKFVASTRTPQASAHVAAHVAQLDPFSQYQLPSRNGIILYPGMDGGAEWGGMAYDAARQLLFVNANEVPYLLRLTELAADEGEGVELAYLMRCAGCHGADMAGDGVAVPSLVNLSDRLSVQEVWRVVTHGRGRMPAFASEPWYVRMAALWYVYTHDGSVPESSVTAGESRNFINAGFQRFTDQDGLPASEPPWGTLTAIDLATDSIHWRIPLGDYPRAIALGHQGLGSENYGGPLVTASGLVFIAATPDRSFRALDADTGELLWQTTLPHAGFATPASYAIDGRQYIVIAAGGGKLGEATGDSYLAFSIEQE